MLHSVLRGAHRGTLGALTSPRGPQETPVGWVTAFVHNETLPKMVFRRPHGRARAHRARVGRKSWPAVPSTY